MSTYDYQKKATDWILYKKQCALFADCGLGKTKITLDAMSEALLNFEVEAFLVIAPLRVARLVWPLEIEKWPEVRWMKYTILHGKEKEERLKQKHQVYIINYEGIPWLCNKLRGDKHIPFDSVIFDELSKLKRVNTKRFNFIRSLLPVMKYRVGLTGTPTPHSLLDIFAQMYVIDRGESLGKSITRFRETYFESDFMGYNWTAKSFAEKKINEKIKNRVFRIDSRDHLDLIEPEFSDIYIDFTPDASKRYKKLEKEFFTELDNGSVEVFNAASLTNKLLQFSGGAVYTDSDSKEYEEVHAEKIKALISIVAMNPNKPVIVAYTYRHELIRIQKEFPECETFNSSMSEKEEKNIIDRWSKKQIPMLVIHPASAGHGLNLHEGGNIIIWFTLTWNYEHYHQCNKRIDRVGQENRPKYYRIIARNTIEEVVATTLERRENQQDNILEALRLYRKGIK